MSSHASRAPRARSGPRVGGVEHLSRWAHQLRSTPRTEATFAALAFGGLIGLRYALFPIQSDDWHLALQHWWTFLQQHGFSGLGQQFANYNVPYLYLLLAGTKVQADGLVWIKSVSTVADLALALGSAGVLRELGGSRRSAFIGGAVVLALPEVVLNSAAWGQADSIYSAFIIWALLAALRGRASLTWALFAMAFAFKMQAAFFLPAFVIVHVVRRWGWRGPAIGVVAFLATETPALVAGRSIGSLAGVYLRQAAEPAHLSMNAPTLYAMLPESPHDLIRATGMGFAVVCVGLLSIVALVLACKRALTGRSALLLVVAIGEVAVYTLPMMHERYFFAANVLLLVYALVQHRALPLAVAAQVIACSTYAHYLLHQPLILPLPLLAVGQGAVVGLVVWEFVRSMRVGAVYGAPAGPVAQADRGLAVRAG